MSANLLPIRLLLDESRLPLDFITSTGPIADVLDRVGFTQYTTRVGPDSIEFAIELGAIGELALALPGLDGFAFVIASDASGDTRFTLDVAVSPRGMRAAASNISLGLRFPPEILKPVPGPGAPLFTQIDVRGRVLLDENFDVHIQGFDALSLPPSMIGNSGIIISADDVKLDLSRTSSLPEVIAAGFDESFRGVFIGEARIQFPEGFPELAPEDLVLQQCAIGSGGVSGRLEAHYTPTWDAATKSFTGPGGSALFGVPFGLKTIAIGLKQNAFVESRVEGQLLLPFFDVLVDVEIGFSLDGGFTIKLSGDGSGYTFERAGVVRVAVESLELDVSSGRLTTKLSGTLTPLLGDLAWPGVRVDELSIDSNGNVHLEGGWLDLREQYALDFHGFHIELTKVGFGKDDDGGKWIGFSGALKLVHELSAGASVDGLRLHFYDVGAPRLTFDGVGVELTIPKVLHLKGEVAYEALEHRFVGAVQLDLLALDLEIDATLVIGTADGKTYLGVYLSAELPAGIPLFATGLALYGVAGLFALGMEPDRHAEETWYDGYFLRAPTGVSDLAHKWRPQTGSMALGAGVTLGTAADNGHAFNGKLLLVIVFPGPILLLEGKANLLKKRAQLDAGEPNFRALAVLDQRAGTFLVGLDARYKKGDDGELIDIHAGAEVFYNLHDSSAWHVYLGQREPREKRLRSRLFQLYDADSYFMLDAHQLALGSSSGFAKKWQFGPLKVNVAATIDGDAVLSRHPDHLTGELHLHGEAGLSVWGYGAALSVDARIAADVFDPYHLLGEFSVGIGLPWPLPDFDADISLEWGPVPTPPPLPAPLREVAVEHLKVTTTWPLARPTLLVPALDRGDGYLADPPPVADESAPPPGNAPVVPLDARPHLTFARPMNDDALVGVNPRPLDPEWERIGDPERQEGPVRVRFGLTEVALERWVGTWQTVARKGTTPNPAGIRDLYGSWAPIPGETAQPVSVKLWLWSRSAFDYTRHGGESWDESFGEQFPLYPCVPPPPQKGTVCCVIEHDEPEEWVRSPWRCREAPQIVLSWPGGPRRIETVDPPIAGLTRAIRFEGGRVGGDNVWIELPPDTRGVSLVLRSERGVSAFAIDKLGVAHPFNGGTPDQPIASIMGEFERVLLRSDARFYMASICALVGPDAGAEERWRQTAQHIVDETARWSQIGDVLEPHGQYRLRIVTRVQAEGDGELSGYQKDLTQTALAYFRTEGPPGLATLSLPVGTPSGQEFRSGLDDLTAYVRGTIPPTLARPGEPPRLARPVYRAYDVGVDFNEDYVDLMYHLERRDLGLYLYDANDQPVRDPEGRLLVLQNRWGRQEELTLDASESRWTASFDAAGCASIDIASIPHDVRLNAVAPLLAPDTLHEARLVPLLLHEDFAAYTVGTFVSGGGRLGPWLAVDEGTSGGPSRWEVREEGTPSTRSIVQTSNIQSGTIDGNDPVKPGTVLLLVGSDSLPLDHPDRPTQWTDYRVSASLRAADDDAFGLVFRYLDAQHYLRFSLDRERRYRRLVRVVNGVHTVLAEDDFTFRLDHDYQLSVEAIGSAVRVYQDGALAFAVQDETLLRGTIGLYSWANTGARFSDLRIDDYRRPAPIAYGFQFVTSRFANFRHQLHSGDDLPWYRAADPPGNAAAILARAQDPAAAITENEAADFDALTTLAFGGGTRALPARLELTRLRGPDGTLAILVDTSEPIVWSRVDIALERATPRSPFASAAGSLKLLGAEAGVAEPNQESVSFLVRETSELGGARVDWRRLPGPLAESLDSTLLWEADLEGDGGELFRESFGPNALDRYRIIDDGQELGPSQWSVLGGAIRQTTNVFGGDVSPESIEKPGTVALFGDDSWSDLRLEVGLRSDDDDAIGVVFRRTDTDNFYRFSMDRERSYRRLVKRVAGVTTTLWEDHQAYALGRSYALRLDAVGAELVAHLDGVLLFAVEDEALTVGRAGLYAWGNTGARFEAVRASRLERQSILWRRGFETLQELAVVDAPNAIEGASAWDVQDEALVQTSNIRTADASALRAGTIALAGDEDWDDVELSVRLRSDTDGGIGALIRATGTPGPGTPVHSYYRFSMDRRLGFRRFVRVTGGTVNVLWQQTSPPAFEVGRDYRLTLQAIGPRFTAWLDDQKLFEVTDENLRRGKVGFYADENPGARFEEAVVLDAAQRVGEWVAHDESAVGGPSRWRISGGALTQRAAVGDSPAGTFALAPERSFGDLHLRVRVRSDELGAVGVLFRYRDRDNHYRWTLDATRTVRRLVRVAGGVATVLFEEAAGFAAGQPIELTVDAVGARLTGYVGTERRFVVEDGTHTSGYVGLWCAANAGARFERVRAERPSRERRALLRDRFAVGDLGGWSFVDDGSSSGPSAWALSSGVLRQSSDIYSPPIDRNTLAKRGTLALTGNPLWSALVFTVQLQSFDDDAIGVVFRYVDGNNFYRFSMDSQRNYRRLIKCVGGAFTLLWEAAAGYEVGRAYSFTVSAMGNRMRLWLDDVPLLVVDDPQLSTGRMGLYTWGNTDARFSNVAVYRPEEVFSDWRIDEPFFFDIAGRWQVVDRGVAGGPSVWSVTDGVLSQTSGIAGVPAATLALAEGVAESEFRLQVRLSTGPSGSSSIVFAYVDDTHYHLLVFEAGGVRRLVAVEGASQRIVWEGTGALTSHRSYCVTIDATGGELRGWLDAELLFSLEHEPLLPGKVGVACEANPALRVNELRLADPAWALYHEFDREPRTAAGACLRLHAGNAAQAVPIEAGVEARFVATLDEPGRLRLPRSRAELRLRGADGITHQRRLLPATAYSSIGPRVLRKADGAAFWLVADTLPAGEYRMKMTFRRDNRPADPVVLTERGSSDPEMATLDFSIPE